MGKTAREVMSGGAECVGENESLAEAAKKLADLNVGAMPICGEDDRLKGMLTDRDIVVKVIAQDKDPARTTAGEIADQPEVVTIGADDSVDEALHTMTTHKVRRLPVIDGHRLIGVVSQADLASQTGPGRWMQPEEIADTFVFLSSDAASGISGSLLLMHSRARSTVQAAPPVTCSTGTTAQSGEMPCRRASSSNWSRCSRSTRKT